MRLSELNPIFLNEHNGRVGAGVEFDCPCGCGNPCYVPFKNALDGSRVLPDDDKRGWERTGDNFENLTLQPSIHRVPPFGCGWHGYIINGDIVNC